MEHMFQRTALGHVAESIAAKFLRDRGYDILGRNYRKPWGELDIIARKGSVVVFVEVKANARPSDNFDPEVRADQAKLMKVVRTARTYLASKCSVDQEWQIDIISVILDREHDTAHVRHFKNIEFSH